MISSWFSRKKNWDKNLFLARIEATEKPRHVVAGTQLQKAKTTLRWLDCALNLKPPSASTFHFRLLLLFQLCWPPSASPYSLTQRGDLLPAAVRVTGSNSPVLPPLNAPVAQELVSIQDNYGALCHRVRWWERKPTMTKLLLGSPLKYFYQMYDTVSGVWHNPFIKCLCEHDLYNYMVGFPFHFLRKLEQNTDKIETRNSTWFFFQLTHFYHFLKKVINIGDYIKKRK